MKLVLLPGMDGTGRMFAPFMAAAPSGTSAQTIAYPLQLAGVDRLVHHVLRVLPRKGPYALVAESFSGPIAIQVAASHPPGLRGLILCATFATSPLPWLPRGAAALLRSPILALAPSRMRERAMLGHGASAELRSLLRDALRELPAETLARRARTVLRVDTTRQLAEVDVPILVLTASADGVVPRSCSKEILRIRPDAAHWDIDAPHLLLQRAPDAAWQAIQAFVSGLPPSREADDPR